MGVYDEETGSGFGRLMPYDQIDIVKLLSNRGFEFFPCFRRPHQSFTGYLFAVNGGAKEILDQGRKLADSLAESARRSE